MKKWVIMTAVLVILAGAGIFALYNAKKPIEKVPAPAQEKSQAQKILESMTLEEKVGQMFLVSVSNSSIDKEDIASYHLGGYLFFADFFKTRSREQASTDIASYQESASIPMLMAVDEEGGTVVRVSRFSAYRESPFSSPRALYQAGGLDRIRQDTEEKSDLLLSLGINVNLAPVCDISTDKSSFIYPRTLGEDAKTVSDYVTTVIEVMDQKKIGSALKHFPGYGDNGDTHTGTATDNREYEDFVSRDFLPFEAGITAGAPCILISHNIVRCMDKENPASLSPRVHEILRNELGFDGVIMTDDLVMDGVKNESGDENIAVAAILAGNDLLCSSGYREQIPAVCQAVAEGKISQSQIDKSALRILEWKDSLGLLKNQ